MVKRIDLTGKRFGNLTVIRDDGTKNTKGEIMWLCKCDCGNTKHIYHYSLVSKKKPTKSCGCLQKKVVKQNLTENLTGKKFGRLEVIKKVAAKKRVKWLCKCECGNEKEVWAHLLKSGTTKSCGCIQKEQAKGKVAENFGFVEDTSLTSLKKGKPITNTSGVKGVYKTKNNKWMASITFQKQQHYLGVFENKEDAVKARKRAEEEYFEPILKRYKSKYKRSAE